MDLLSSTSTARNSDEGAMSPDAPPMAAEMAPLLVRVPWLAPRTPATHGVPTSPCEPVATAVNPFVPLTYVAAMGTGAEQLAIDWGASTQEESHAPWGRPSALPPSLLSAAPYANSPAPTPQATPSREAIKVGETQIRFDPPQGRASAPSAIDADPLAMPPSSWQQQLVAIDQFLKEYRRVILAAVVVTVTGLMLLVINRGGGVIEAPADTLAPPAAEKIAPAPPDDLRTAPDLRPIDPPRMAEALGPEGLAIRHDLEKSPSPEFDITPIKSPPEGSGSATETNTQTLPYPSTDLPAWQGVEHQSADDETANIAIIRSVRPTR